MYKRLTLALVLLAALTSSTAAWAQDCTTPIIDEPGILGSNVTNVTEAMKQLRDAGAEPYVRIWNYRNIHGAPDIKGMEPEIIRECPTWGDNGKLRGSIILWVLLMENRKHGVFYGTLWVDRADKEMNTIAKRILTPQVRAGNYAGGIVLTFNQMTVVVRREMTVVATPATPPPAQVEKTTVIERQTAPTDYSGLWEVLRWLLGIFVLAAILYVLYRWVARVSARNAAGRRAISAMNRASTRLNAMNDLTTTVRERLETAVARTTLVEAAKYRKRLEKIDNRRSNAIRDYETLDQTTILSQLRLTEEFDNVCTTFDAVTTLLGSIESDLNTLNRDLGQLEEYLASRSTRIQLATTTIDATEKAIDEAQSKGFKVGDLPQKLGEAKTKRDAALNHTNDREAIELALQAALLANSVGEQSPTLRQRNIEASLRLANIHLVDAAAKVVEAKTTFDDMQQAYSRESWLPVQKNGSRAAKKLVAAEDRLKKVELLLTVEVQDWEQAQTLIEGAEARIKRAHSFLRSITSLSQTLHEVETEAAEVIERAAGDVAEAEAYVKQCAATTTVSDEVYGHLRKAKELLAQAQAEVLRDKPDYLNAIKWANQASGACDEVLSDHRPEHKAYQRAKQKAESSLTAAERRLKKADEYFEDNERYIGEKAKKKLAEAHGYLTTAQQEGNGYVTIAKWADQAEEAGKEAQKQAEKDAAKSRKADRYDGTVYNWNTQRQDRTTDVVVVETHHPHRHTGHTGGATHHEDRGHTGSVVSDLFNSINQTSTGWSGGDTTSDISSDTGFAGSDF